MLLLSHGLYCYLSHLIFDVIKKFKLIIHLIIKWYLNFFCKNYSKIACYYIRFFWNLLYKFFKFYVLSFKLKLTALQFCFISRIFFLFFRIFIRFLKFLYFGSIVIVNYSLLFSSFQNYSKLLNTFINLFAYYF